MQKKNRPGATDEELAELVAEDTSRPVRPVGVNGQTEFWNANATWFMYPPEFAFPPSPRADGYRVRVVDAAGKVRLFDQKGPAVSLEKIWTELPSGRTEVWCDAFHRWGIWTVARNFRVFWKMEPYRPGAYPKAPRGYAEAAMECCRYLLGCGWLRQYAATGSPDPGYPLNCYPAKTDSAVVKLMAGFSRLSKDDRAAALRLARAAADHLIAVSQPQGAPLAHFPPTYAGGNLTAKEYAGMNMLDYPGQAGSAYLALYGETDDVKYLEAAKGIGETYLRLQGGDGTWFLKMFEKDGRPVAANRLHPGSVIDFMDGLFKATGDRRFRECAARAFGFYETGPLKDWNWEAQFEDVEPTERYENLTKHPACSLAILLAGAYPHDAGRIAQARELLRFAEDQFVVWKRPNNRDDDDLMALPGNGWDVEPAVVEQYFYREAVDASAAKLVNTYLALHRATGNPLDLAKARTLGDSIVRSQKDNGRIPTIWTTEVGKDARNDWINCMAMSVDALINLSSFDR